VSISLHINCRVELPTCDKVDTRPHCMHGDLASRGQWPVTTLRHSCPTDTRAAGQNPEGMTILCVVTFTNGAVRSALPATAVFLLLTAFIPTADSVFRNVHPGQCITCVQLFAFSLTNIHVMRMDYQFNAVVITQIRASQ